LSFVRQKDRAPDIGGRRLPQTWYLLWVLRGFNHPHLMML